MGKLPEILFLLREKIEKESDIRPTTPDEFYELVDYINAKLKDIPVAKGRPGYCLSEKTIRRLWEKEKYDSAPSLTTLNMLSKVAGYKRWEDFEKEIAAYMEKISYYNEKDLPMSKLKAGDRVVVGSYPELYVFLEFVDYRKFRVLFSDKKSDLPYNDDWYYTVDLFGKKMR